MTLCAFFFENVKKYKIKETSSYISIFTNLRRTDDETKNVKNIYNYIN